MLLLVREGYSGTACQCLRQNNQKPGAAARDIPCTALFLLPSPSRPLPLAEQAKKILFNQSLFSSKSYVPRGVPEIQMD